jgi:hypothetical protein
MTTNNLIETAEALVNQARELDKELNNLWNNRDAFAQLVVEMAATLEQLTAEYKQAVERIEFLEQQLVYFQKAYSEMDYPHE